MDTDAFTTWIARLPVGFTPETIVDAARRCVIVGLGMETRESHEVFSAAAETALQLTQDGFTALALLENPRVAALYDRHIAGEEVDLAQALSQAWGPWQIQQWAQTLERLRALNLRDDEEGEPEDGRRPEPDTPQRLKRRVRIIGLGEPRALPQDYDRILELLRGFSAETAAQVEEILQVIRVAHDSGEHVLRARGTHPGTPFVELAHRARALVAEFGKRVGAEKRTGAVATEDEQGTSELREALELLDGVVAFHAESVEAGYDAAEEERAAAQRLLEHHRDTGERIILWDGIAHTAAHQEQGRVGAHLRSVLGADYLAVLFSFGQGEIPDATLPAPRPDSLDALLASTGGELTMDLRAPIPADALRVLERPMPARLVSGIYDPADDAAHYLTLPSVRESFDVLVHLPEITPVQPLPGP